MPHEHRTVLCNYHNADEALVAKAIDGALAAKLDWENTPFSDRAAIFLKAADLAASKYRYVPCPVRKVHRAVKEKNDSFCGVDPLRFEQEAPPPPRPLHSTPQIPS